MTAMTDEQVKDMLNRLLAQDESDLTVDDLFRLPAGVVSLLCLLAESQDALGKVIERGCYDISLSAHRTEDCPACKDHIEIASNARKGEK